MAKPCKIIASPKLAKILNIQPNQELSYNDWARILHDGGFDTLINEEIVSIKGISPQPKAVKTNPTALSDFKAGLAKFKGAATTAQNAAERVASALKEAGIKVKMIDNEEDYNREAQKRGGGKGTEGMFISTDGVIYLNQNKLQGNWGTTIVWHEGTHPIINIIRNTNPDLFNKIVSGAKKLTADKGLQNALKFAEAYRDGMTITENSEGKFELYDGENLVDTFESEQAAQDYIDAVVADEFIVEAIARIVDGKINIEQLPSSLRQSIVDFINNILNALGIKGRVSDTDIAQFKKLAAQVSDVLQSGRSISEIVGKENVGKFENNLYNNLLPQMSISEYGRSGLKKYPILDKKTYLEKLKNGILAIKSPKESLQDKTFMLTFPDDLYVGEMKINKTKIADFGGGVIYAIVEGEDGRMWASVSESTAKAFADNVNKSLKLNNGEGVVVLVKGSDTKHISSMSAKVGFMKILLNYADSIKDQNTKFSSDLITAIKEIYSIGNAKTPSSAIKMFDNYLVGGRDADGQTMKEAASAYDGLRTALVKKANPFITKMAQDMGYGDEYFNATKLKGKNPVYEATNLTIDKMFKDLLQEDFLKGVPSGSAYAAIKVNSEVDIVKDLSHPSYPWVIKTKDGSPVKLELFDKTFMTYGENEAISGRYDTQKEVVTGGFGQVSYTVPKFKLKQNFDFSKEKGAVDLKNTLGKYKSISDFEKQSSVQASKGQREEVTLPDGRTVETKPLDVEVVNGFYSPIEKNLMDYGKDKIKAKDWLNVVGKGDEAVFTGVRAFLEGKDPNAMVSKQEILDYMKDNRISVSEVVLKEGEGKTAKERFRRNIELKGEKENYKEVLVTLPNRNKFDKTKVEVKKKYLSATQGTFDIYYNGELVKAGYDLFSGGSGNYGEKTDTELNETAKQIIEKGDKFNKVENKQGNFISTHFDEPNILVHLRMNTRTDADGNKVLFLEEVQSDFGQSYKKDIDNLIDFVNKNEEKVIEAYKKNGKLRVEC